MFLKPFTVKSNSRIKATDRKQLISQFCSQYNLKSEDLLTAFDSKEVFRIRINTVGNLRVQIYKFGNVPLIIENEKQLLPTVFLLWYFPNLLYQFKIHSSLVTTLANGADLMIPGIDRNGKPLSIDTFDNIGKGVLCSIATIDNSAPVAIGYTLMSNYDMFMSCGKGKAVSIFHIMGDEICSLGSAIHRPLIPWPENAHSVDSTLKDEELDNGDIRTELTVDELDLNAESSCTPVETASLSPHESIVDADELLYACFLKSLKIVKCDQLPMQVNVFYSQYVLAQRPPSTLLDIKKTSFKKVLVFLTAMQDEGFIELKESKPGIFVIKSITKDHMELRGISGSLPSASVEKSILPEGYEGPPTIIDVRIIKGPASTLYSNFGYKSGDCISQAEARKALDNYIRSKNLQCPTDPSRVLMEDKMLTGLCSSTSMIELPDSTLAKPRFVVPFCDIMSHVLKQLPVAYSITYPNGRRQIWTKKKPPQIIVYTLTKAGKKLTRIVNVDIFNIDPESFVKQLKLSLACSVGPVDDAQYPTDTVIQAQGTHTASISAILVDLYAIPKRFINGYKDPDKKKK